MVTDSPETAPASTAFEPARVGFANGDVKVVHRAEIDDRTGRLTIVDRVSYPDPNDNQLSEAEHVRHYAAHAWTWVEPEIDSGTLWVQHYACTQGGEPLNDRTAWFRLAWMVPREEAVKVAARYVADQFNYRWIDVAPDIEQDLEPPVGTFARPVVDRQGRFHNLAFRWLPHPATWPESRL
ncbi:Uncharacterised protein [Mycobacteroides abscessus]|uniref:Uncharacterized protein n=1 Tax=Mycolicibacterium llatzerense TaxID=280871 RepID=A0A0D1KXZ3_9MYCO|nr:MULTISPECIES: hypothetical protein [Mycobacteriaceae]KIU13635.1 hypothetical protein TL10_28755 [Mycolicibacterium llatzerense]MCT7372571.1 hypothetical protein [Mycolicibacterium llatzerense]WGI35816.1 hypothetical protein QDT91_28165 [Mycolicibacterium aubagnense]CPT78116.1 Uncharacterised protein [Mycobacteroides abscessus]CPU63245.1 Uncharacterised protein [Mycobacteroides abscessus]